MPDMKADPVLLAALTAVEGAVKHKSKEVFSRTAKLTLEDGRILKVQIKNAKEE